MDSCPQETPRSSNLVAACSVDLVHASRATTKMIIERIRDHKIDLTSVMHILQMGMEVMEQFPILLGSQKKECLIAVLDAITRDPDELLACTDDDLLPQQTMNTIAYMIREGVLEQTIDMICQASKGYLAINRILIDKFPEDVSCIPPCLRASGW
jgi:hypothetical protein